MTNLFHLLQVHIFNSRYPVAFTLSNGEITEVKTHDEDPLYYVNIKRGVLSAFVFKLSQTKMEMQEVREIF